MTPLVVLLLAARPVSLVADEGEEVVPLVVLVPLGNPSPDLVRQAARALSQEFLFRVHIEPSEAMPEEAFYAPRSRWRAERIVDALARAEHGEAIRVVGITEKPISTTKGANADWGIAGLGMIGGRAAIVSSFYFRNVKDQTTFSRYFRNLVLHEFGHTLGRPHCPHDECIMADAKGNAIRAAKQSSGRYCEQDTLFLSRYRH